MGSDAREVFALVHELKCFWVQSSKKAYLQFVWQNMRLRKVSLQVSEQHIRISIDDAVMNFQLCRPINVEGTNFRRFQDHLLVSISKKRSTLWPYLQLEAPTKTILINDDLTYHRGLLPVLDIEGNPIIGEIHEIFIQTHRYGLRAKEARLVSLKRPYDGYKYNFDNQKRNRLHMHEPTTNTGCKRGKKPKEINLFEDVYMAKEEEEELALSKIKDPLAKEIADVLPKSDAGIEDELKAEPGGNRKHYNLRSRNYN